MRSLVIDFYLTVLFPLVIFALLVLWNSVRVYRWPSRRLYEHRPIEQGEELVALKQLRSEEKWQAKGLIWISGIALLLSCAVIPMGDHWKLNIAYFAWRALQFVGAISFIIAALMAWDYVEKQERLKLLACLLAMLMAAASTLHFFHQAINAEHVICPDCSDDDERPDN